MSLMWLVDPLAASKAEVLLILNLPGNNLHFYLDKGLWLYFYMNRKQFLCNWLLSLSHSMTLMNFFSYGR